MRINVKKAMPILFISVFVGYLIFLGIKETTKTPEVIYAPKTSGDYQVMTGLIFTEYESGNKKMEVRAEEVSIGPGKIGFFRTPLIKESRMKKPEISFYENGKEISTLRSDRGTMNMGNRKAILKDRVTLTTSLGKKLYTEEMAIDPKRGLLSINGRFTLEDGNEIKGKGLKSDMELKRMEIRIKRDE